MTATVRNPRLDIIKGVAIIAVVVVHTGWHAATTYTDALPLAIWLCVVFFAHASVPVFMMIAGFFYDDIMRRGRMNAYIAKLIRLGITGCVLLAVCDIFFRPEMYDNLTWRSWLRFAVFGEYPLGEPMWFIPALAGAVLLMRLTDKAGLWPKAALYIIGAGALGMLLSRLPGISSDWGRNALLMGFPLMGLGRLVREREQKVSLPTDRRNARIMLIAGICLTAVECVRVVHQGYPLPFTPGLLMIALGMLLIAVRGQRPDALSGGKPKGGFIAKGLSVMGNHSGTIYVVHGAIFPMLVFALPASFICLTGVLPALTVAGSLLIALLVKRIRSR